MRHLQESSDPFPTLSEFMDASVEEVRRFAPMTVVFGTGGTRRQAALQGLAQDTSDYVAYTRSQMFSAQQQLLHHGVLHIFNPIVVDGNAQEQTAGYAENLMRWVASGIADQVAIDAFAAMDCRAHLFGTEFYPDLAEISLQLAHETATSKDRHLWFTMTPDSTSMWNLVLQKISAHGAVTHEEAVLAVYGEPVPATDVLLLDFGKPQVFASAVPPLLACKLHCYWRQSLGYNLDEATIRRVFYDYAFNRRTWRSNKEGRAEEVLRYVEKYVEPPIIGEGYRLGSFWFPQGM